MDEQQTLPTTSRTASQRPRCEARLARRSRRFLDPLHHAQDPLLRGAQRGRPRADGAQRRHHSRGDRHRFSRRCRGARDLEGGRRRRQGRTRAFRPRHVPLAGAAHGAPRVRSACPQSRAQRRDRRQEHRVRAGVRLAVRAQSRRRAPLCAHRGLPQFRQARVHGQLAAPFGRHDLRTRRSAGQQAPPRHGVQPSEIQRQGVHGLRDRARARRRLGGDGEHRVRRRARRSRDRPAEDDASSI